MILLIASLYIVGLIVYLLKRDLLIYYYLCWVIFAPYVSSFIVFTEGADLVVRGQSNYFLLLLYIIDTIRYGKLNVNRKTIILLSCLIVNLLVCALFNSVPIFKYIKWAISSIIPIVLLIALLKNSKINIRIFSVFIFVMLLIQLFIGFCQYYTGILFVSPLFAMDAESGMLTLGSVMGTFHGTNAFAVHVFLFYLYYYIISKPRSFFSKLVHAILLAIVAYAILLSGIRTYLLLLLASVGSIYIIKSRHKSVAILTIVGVLLFSASYLIVSSYGSQYTVDNPIERQINGISALRYGDTDNSTLSYSMYVLENYYSPIDFFGKGLLNTPKGYGKIILPEYGYPDADVSDAMLAVTLVEYGIIFFFLILYFFFYQTTNQFPYADRVIRRCQIAFFISLLAATVTDAGIFNATSLLMLSMISYSQWRIESKQ